MLSRARLWDFWRRAQGVVRLERGLAALSAEVRELGSADRRELELGLAALAARLERLETAESHTHALLRDQVGAALRAIVCEDAENRRRLWAARETPEYEAVFAERDPLVSIVVPTRDRPEQLCERALPSLLNQSHDRIEVIVVGDDSGPETPAAVARLGDSRVRFRNLTQRLPGVGAPRRRWYVASVMARNEGFRLAGGSWRMSFDDDDELYPRAIERLLAAACEQRAEVVYGRFRQIWPDGAAEHGQFPPTYGEFAWQSGLSHASLRFFERELFAAAFEEPNDIFMAEAMLRAGARFAMIPDLVCDLYPTEGLVNS